MTWSTKWPAIRDKRRAPLGGQNPRRLQLKVSSWWRPHSPPRSLRKPCARMPHLSKASNSALDIAGQLGTRAGFGVGDEAGRVMLHQAVQRGLLRAVALVVDRGAIVRPSPRSGLPADGLTARLPKW